MNTKVISPDVVDLWEAILTLAFFGILVVLSYMADKKFYLGKREENDESENDAGIAYINFKLI